MKRFRTAAFFLLLAGNVFAQQMPHLAYVYPAGGRIGTTVQITVGGQFLMTVSNVFVTGSGISATVLDRDRPMNQKEFNELRDRLKALQEKFQATRKRDAGTNVWTMADAVEREQIRAKILKNPPNRTANPAMIDRVSVKISIAADAAPGEREIRLATPNALSNPLRFCVGTLLEISKPAAKPANPDLDKYLERIGGRPAPAVHEQRQPHHHAVGLELARDLDHALHALGRAPHEQGLEAAGDHLPRVAHRETDPPLAPVHRQHAHGVGLSPWRGGSSRGGTWCRTH